MSRKFYTSIDMTGRAISSLGAPGDNNSAARLLDVINRIGAPKHTVVRVVATTNIILTSGQTIAGVSLGDGDRILLTEQSTGTENGVWVVNSSGAWSRPTEYPAGSDVSNLQVTVGHEDDTNDDTRWVCSNAPGGAVVDTSGLTFIKIYDPDVVPTGPTKFAANVGNNSDTVFGITHNLDTTDVLVQVFEVATGATVECTVERTDADTVTLTFDVAPTTDQFRVVIIG